MAVWVEDLTEDSFKICLREVKIFDGLHRGITIVSEVKILFLVWDERVDGIDVCFSAPA